MRYISILRGINVSGQKLIKMADLKSMYESLDFRSVVTYIQSGNVIFDTVITDKLEMKTLLEGAIEEKYKFHVPVQIRTNGDMEKIIKNNPFAVIDVAQHGSKVSVTFLSSTPAEVRVVEMQNYVVAPEKLEVIGQEVYLYCPNSYGRTKLSNTFLEKKLGVEATTRNLKTVHKLYELSKTF